MIGLLVQVLVICLVAGLALWILREASPDPVISKWGRIIVIVIAAIALIYTLMGLAGGVRL